MSRSKFTVSEKVIIHMPNDRKYDGLTAIVEDVDHKDVKLTYRLTVFNRDDKKMRVPLWLPEHMLKPFRKRNVYELKPGDVIVNRSGLRFEVIEPLAPVFFITPIGSPSVTMHVSAKDLANEGYQIEERTDE